jgi:hypothetical protein
MAAHIDFPPAGAEALVRGDPATIVVRIRVAGVDQDITSWVWRSMVRDRINGTVKSTCDTFEVRAADDLPELFPDTPSPIPSVLLVHWTMEQTAEWHANWVADIEQTAPAKRTWLIIDHIRLDDDVSYDATMP